MVVVVVVVVKGGRMEVRSLTDELFTIRLRDS